MNDSKNQGETLVMYDVRGIQDYIFRTNKIVNVMGASHIIEGIILNSLYAAVQALGLSTDEEEETAEVLLDWEKGCKKDKEMLRFLADDAIKIQVLYEGGGNAFVLFRTKQLCTQVNRFMARIVLEKSYSLQLAVATVPLSSSYYEDFTKVTRKMSEIKGESPVPRLTAALPIMEVEIETGFPAQQFDTRFGKKALVSYETAQKRCKKNQSIIEKQERNLENLITEKGIDSNLAIVHIDGNNMGNRIKNLMNGEKDYTNAIDKIRHISMNINHGFKDTFKITQAVIEKNAKKHPAFQKKKTKIFVRPLLVAGDDITFICNAKVALSAVEVFCEDIAAKVLYQEAGQKKNLSLYGFSVCAGIAYMHSHFPFKTAYEVAEQCCESAKKRAKQEQYLSREKRVGNWVDFQICKSVHTANLKEFRRQEYILYDKSVLTLRPYFLPMKGENKWNEACKDYDFSIFKEAYQYFSNDENIARNVAQAFKQAYTMGIHEVEAVKSFARSRGKKLPKKYSNAFREHVNEKGIRYQEAVWYDALELLDYYVEVNESEKDNTSKSEAAE